jgi:hypothetical protein
LTTRNVARAIRPSRISRLGLSVNARWRFESELDLLRFALVTSIRVVESNSGRLDPNMDVLLQSGVAIIFVVMQDDRFDSERFSRTYSIRMPWSEPWNFRSGARSETDFGVSSGDDDQAFLSFHSQI